MRRQCKQLTAGYRRRLLLDEYKDDDDDGEKLWRKKNRQSSSLNQKYTIFCPQHKKHAF